MVEDAEVVPSLQERLSTVLVVSFIQITHH